MRCGGWARRRGGGGSARGRRRARHRSRGGGGRGIGGGVVEALNNVDAERDRTTLDEVEGTEEKESERERGIDAQREGTGLVQGKSRTRRSNLVDSNQAHTVLLSACCDLLPRVKDE